jgi:hypothetical protein
MQPGEGALSVLLDARENTKALAEYLGHSDPGLLLRVYAVRAPHAFQPGAYAEGDCKHLRKSDALTS